MASAHPLGKLLEEAICPICKDYFKDPVTTDCGHNFCQVCIIKHCEKQEKEPEEVCCPQCMTGLKKEKVQTNRHLASMVKNIQQLTIDPKNLKKQGVCREHEDKMKVFCEDDGEVICLVCDEIKEHRSHTLVLIEKATQKYKVELHKDIEHLKEVMEKVSKLESEERNKPNYWKRRGECHRQHILSEFEKVEQFLSREKTLILQRLAKEETDILKKINKNVTKLSQRSSSLQQLISELEDKSQQPAEKLLEDIKGVLARSEQLRLQELELITAELKVMYRVPGMLEMPLQVTDKLEVELRWRNIQLYTVDVTLDPDTAHPELILSEDRKSVGPGDKRQDLPDNPERFDTHPAVLGAERFKHGRHYWEVEVGDKPHWILGVCRESVSRKGRVLLSPGNGYWVVQQRYGEYKTFTSPTTSLPVTIRPRQVGVFLDYKAGKVSFYKVTDGSHLFTFTDTFSGTLRPYFYTGYSDEGDNVAPLTICPVPAQAHVRSQH